MRALLQATCRTLRDILLDPAEAAVWVAAWEAYKTGFAADGEGIEDARGR